MSLAAPAPARPARPRRQPAAAPKPARRARSQTLARPRSGRSPVGAGVLWVLLIAALLGGVVAINVGALRNSIEASRVSGQVAELRAQNQALESNIAEDSGIGRISAQAKRLGMVLAQPQKSDFIKLHPGRRHAAPPQLSHPRSVKATPSGRAQRMP
jgi:cell division protein FtsL